MISTAKIRDNFSRVAHTYEQYADIQGLLADELLKKVILEARVYDKILDIGCGTGKLTQELSQQFLHSKVMGLDISEGMSKLTKARGIEAIAADAQALPFSNGTFDLVVSNAAYQWVSNLPLAFKEAQRVLKEKGIFIFSCFGKRTLRELRDCFGIEENVLPEKDSLYYGLAVSGFSEMSVEQNMLKKYFNNATELLYWLKKIGGNRIYQRQPHITTGTLKAVSDFYAATYRNNGKIYATFEVIKIRARK